MSIPNKCNCMDIYIAVTFVDSYINNLSFSTSDVFPRSSFLKEEELQSIRGTLERSFAGQNTSSELEMSLKTLAKGAQNFRTLWCETSEVKESGLLNRMTHKEKKLQEVRYVEIYYCSQHLKWSIVIHFICCHSILKKQWVSDTCDI